MNHLEYFKFLNWLKNTLFFPGDLKEDLVRIGVDPIEASFIVTAQSVHSADVVRFYADFRHAEWFPRLIEQEWNKYNEIGERHA